MKIRFIYNRSTWSEELDDGIATEVYAMYYYPVQYMYFLLKRLLYI